MISPRSKGSTPRMIDHSHRILMLEALERYLSKKMLVSVTRVAIAGRDQPVRVNGVTPDLMGVTQMVGQPVYGVVEECDTYAASDSVVRLDSLSRVASAAAYLVVPAACYEPAKSYVLATFPDRSITVLPYGKVEDG